MRRLPCKGADHSPMPDDLHSQSENAGCGCARKSLIATGSGRLRKKTLAGASTGIVPQIWRQGDQSALTRRWGVLPSTAALLGAHARTPPENRQCELTGPLPFAKLPGTHHRRQTAPSISLLLIKPPSRPSARSLRRPHPMETGPHRRTPRISGQA